MIINNIQTNQKFTYSLLQSNIKLFLEFLKYKFRQVCYAHKLQKKYILSLHKTIN